MQRFCALLLVVAGFLLVACARLSPTEEEVVGTWEYDGIDSSPRLVLRRDRVEVVLVSAGIHRRGTAKWVPASWGEWRLDGKTIIVSNDQVFGLDGPRPVGETRRIPIHEFHKNRLVLANGTPDLIRLSAKKERRIWLLSTIYIGGSITAIASMVVATQRAFGRRKRILILIPAIGAASLSVLALLGELAEGGHLIISPKLLAWLQIPSDFIKVGFLTMLLLALAALYFRLNDRRLTE